MKFTLNDLVSRFKTAARDVEAIHEHEIACAPTRIEIERLETQIGKLKKQAERAVPQIEANDQGLSSASHALEKAPQHRAELKENRIKVNTAEI